MLSIKQINAIKRLQKECELYDNIQLKLNWDMLNERDNQSMDFFYEEHGELVAFLALYDFGSTVEVCGMVKPSKRRKHYFSNLWRDALVTIEEKGFKKVLLNTPESSTSAKAWLASQPCTYSFSEFQMQWKEQSIEESNDVLIREAKPEDASFEVSLDVLAFNMNEEDARAHYESIKKKPSEKYYIIEAERENNWKNTCK